MKTKKAKIILGTILVLVVVIAATTVHGLYTAGINFAGPLKHLGIDKITDTYNPEERPGEIIFYGASNFTRWSTMEEDIPQYEVQNHGFGGSDDQDLMDYASVLLYPYQPTIVVFQTGSNDYVHADGTDAEKLAFCMERKVQMFEMFHEQLPDAHFVVLSGLLLPGRSEYMELTQEVNRQLSALCDSNEYMTFVDAEALTYQNGAYVESMFVKDGIHLTSEARIIWANEYIIPALDSIVD